MTDHQDRLPSSATAQAPGPESSAIIELLASIVEPLGQSLPSTYEVVLHQLDLLPRSIVVLSGNLTGRSAGDPATDLLLEQVASGLPTDSIVGYTTKLLDGRELRSTTMIIRDFAGTPIAALCINSDITAWKHIRQLASGMVGELPDAGGVADEFVATARPQETFVHDVDELVGVLLGTAINEIGVPVSLMRKDHKIRVVDSLRKRGMFLIRESTEIVAEALGVSRYTIYNYLNELDAGAADSSTDTAQDDD